MLLVPTVEASAAQRGRFRSGNPAVLLLSILLLEQRAARSRHESLLPLRGDPNSTSVALLNSRVVQHERYGCQTIQEVLVWLMPA